jgi:hypothetical protein
MLDTQYRAKRATFALKPTSLRVGRLVHQSLDYLYWSMIRGLDKPRTA